jgi:signal transduction histidine kinase
MKSFHPVKFFTNNIYLLLILSVLLVIISAIITYRNTQEKAEATAAVIRRYESIESSIQLFSYLKDMETGQRGYIITGDSEFLEPYDSAKVRIKAETDTLNYLVQDDEQQASLLEEKIIRSINNKTEDLEKSINIVNKFGKDSAARKVIKKTGKAHMDTLRILINELIQRERAILSQQNQKLIQNTKLEDMIRFFSFTMIGLTSLVAFVILIQKQRSINELIEKLKKYNEELEQTVKERTIQLLSANQAKDHFLGIASHDLKVPIAGILGLIELMNLENKSRSEKEKEYLGYIQGSCLNMQQLISNLLDINRIEQGATTIKQEDVDLKNLQAKLESSFSPQAQKKNIELDIRVPDDMIKTDPEILYRILENLISNAIKFSPRHKSVSVQTIKKGDQLIFEIMDHGPGIPGDEIPVLFEKFQRLTNKPTGEESSTGLGLSIVRELVKLLKGEITVTSKVGEGSLFTVIIPIK